MSLNLPWNIAATYSAKISPFAWFGIQWIAAQSPIWTVLFHVAKMRSRLPCQLQDAFTRLGFACASCYERCAVVSRIVGWPWGERCFSPRRAVPGDAPTLARYSGVGKKKKEQAAQTVARRAFLNTQDKTMTLHNEENKVEVTRFVAMPPSVVEEERCWNKNRPLGAERTGDTDGFANQHCCPSHLPTAWGKRRRSRACGIKGANGSTITKMTFSGRLHITTTVRKKKKPGHTAVYQRKLSANSQVFVLFLCCNEW